MTFKLLNPMNMLDDKTKERIAKDALKARTIYVKEEADFGTNTKAISYMGISFKEGYIAGAEAEAERSSGLVEALEKSLEWIADIKQKDIPLDDKKGMALYHIKWLATEALNQYNKQ